MALEYWTIELHSTYETYTSDNFSSLTLLIENWPEGRTLNADNLYKYVRVDGTDRVGTVHVFSSSEKFNVWYHFELLI